MRIIFGTGGTGGHLYPALALASYIKQQDPNSEFLFVGTTNRLEAQVVPQMGYAYQGMDLQGLVGSPLNKAKAAWKFVRSIRQSKKIVRAFKPDIVVGFGGYPSSSIVLGAAQLHVPTMIHEQNSIIGLANKMLIKHADAIVACYSKAAAEFPADKTYLYGNPRATQVLEAELRDVSHIYGLDPQKKTVLVVMGSLGSSSVNRVIEAAIEQIGKKDYQFIFVTGQKQYETEKAKLTHLPDNVRLISYVDDMPSLLKSVDLVVTRAGASTLAEITSLGVAALIIPSPYVAMNHQEYNARELVEAHAAEMILEKDLTETRLLETIDRLLDEPNKIIEMSENAKKLGKPQASHDIYELMKKIVKK